MRELPDDRRLALLRALARGGAPASVVRQRIGLWLVGRRRQQREERLVRLPRPGVAEPVLGSREVVVDGRDPVRARRVVEEDEGAL